MGRFVSRDPIGFDGGINLYEFCSNDPIDFDDPLGLDWSVGPADQPWLTFNEDIVASGLSAGLDGVQTGLTLGAHQSSYASSGTPGYTTSVGLGIGALGCLSAAYVAELAPAIRAMGSYALATTGAGAFLANRLASNPEAVQQVDDAATVCPLTGKPVDYTELYHYTDGPGAQGIMESGQINGSRTVGAWRPWSRGDVYLSDDPNISLGKGLLYGLSPAKQQVVIPVQVPTDQIVNRPWGIRIVPGPIPLNQGY
jgi:hypothetical protein